MVIVGSRGGTGDAHRAERATARQGRRAVRLAFEDDVDGQQHEAAAARRQQEERVEEREDARDVRVRTE
ncbi:MAG: hypothetical protein WKF75_20560, partial [Singulisphaera sp.]